MQSENSSNNTNFDNDEISIKELVFKIRDWYHFLLTKWKLMMLIFIISSLIGLAYAFIDKPLYTATLTFAMEEEKSGAGALNGAIGLASTFGIDLSGGGSGGAFTGANLMTLMKSRKIVDKTLLSPVAFNGVKISLVDYYIEFNHLRKKWRKRRGLESINFPLNLNRNKFSLQQDSILKVIYSIIIEKNLSVSQPDKKVSIVTVGVNSIEEEFAKSFCETLVDVTSSYYIEIKSKKSRMNVDILQKQADSIRAELNGAITGVAAASDNVYNLNPAFNVKRTPSTRRQVDVQANTAILTQLVTNLELAKISLRKETPLIQVIDRPVLPLDKDEIGKIVTMLTSGFFMLFLTILYLIINRLFKQIIS